MSTENTRPSSTTVKDVTVAAAATPAVLAGVSRAARTWTESPTKTVNGTIRTELITC